MPRADNPWIELPERPPYILSRDRAAVEPYNRTRATPETRIQDHVLPEPYLGDPSAPVVLLLLNPGAYDLTPGSLTLSQYHGARENLAHGKRLWPFLPLDPRNKDRSGWWRDSLRPLIEDEGIPAARLARGLFSIEYFPYVSKRYGNLRVPSQAYGFALLREALARDALVVVMFGEGRWHDAVPELRTYQPRHRLRSSQNATISERNCPDGYREIVARVTSVA
jgi:hypothetical protein